ncbi:hypothetical protein KC332_g5864 [Hortaea werneckii]|uniref:Initiation-specific alpha-1,6-mannosyltransferase n=2 Tax=Hortaea werneckii TaxID=91943 RepID=A0A3M7IC45_HORWE|nr:hypothetical protein KC350_g7243 [Hortaea werneckii]KAI6834695.1 hypothetical protein KC358_g5726 [Hortaea werneckii]KAI6936613.1 hypothetical protein KC348_g5949 [Hortaea werneckii]KAI6938256.1 hypothetical protein KC341_g5013 [Hortaea werneckii]KAI6971074.1 hypothetical protein KC321_g6965 [Hortaea werneckii]
MHTRLVVLASLAAIILYFCYHQSFLHNSEPAWKRATSQSLPHKIWQTWKTAPHGLNEELIKLSKSWIDMNPDYRYELVTDDASVTYVRERFNHRQDIIEVFEQTTDRVLRADLTRYLTLLGDGGVYTDIDTDCTKPIREWFPRELHGSVGLVLGVEYDSQGGEIRKDFNLPVQLCQWTIMATPGHQVLQNVVETVVSKLSADQVNLESIPSHDLQYVLETTGPRMFTVAVLESLTSQLSRMVTHEEISNLTAPKLIGDTLILPISAFGSGQDHSGSKPWGNDEQLMSHHYFGFKGWKLEHNR